MPKAILLADDSPTIRKIVELTFADSEIRVQTIAGGRGVWEAWESLRPDLVLVDVGLSDPDGYELCRRVKSSERPVPVGLLVGTFEQADAARVADCGADGQLSKPFESTALVDWVEQLLAATAGGAAEPEMPEEILPAEPAESAESAEPCGLSVGELDAPELSDALVDAVARRVIERLSVEVIRDMAREIIPGVASAIVKKRIRELEQEDD